MLKCERAASYSTASESLTFRSRGMLVMTISYDAVRLARPSRHDTGGGDASEEAILVGNSLRHDHAALHFDACSCKTLQKLQRC